jgi:hypothetical protein
MFGGKVPRGARAKVFGTASMVVRQNFVFLYHLWERLYKSDQKKVSRWAAGIGEPLASLFRMDAVIARMTVTTPRCEKHGGCF